MSQRYRKDHTSHPDLDRLHEKARECGYRIGIATRDGMLAVLVVSKPKRPELRIPIANGDVDAAARGLLNGVRP